jgi:hypothetical protein
LKEEIGTRSRSVGSGREYETVAKQMEMMLMSFMMINDCVEQNKCRLGDRGGKASI